MGIGVAKLLAIVLVIATLALPCVQLGRLIIKSQSGDIGRTSDGAQVANDSRPDVMMMTTLAAPNTTEGLPVRDGYRAWLVSLVAGERPLKRQLTDGQPERITGIPRNFESVHEGKGSAEPPTTSRSLALKSAVQEESIISLLIDNHHEENATKAIGKGVDTGVILSTDSYDR